MKNVKTNRRGFVKAAGAAAIGLGISQNARARAPELLRIDEPFHGAVLNRRHGQETDGGLKIRVTGEAPLDDRVTVNGAPAERAGYQFSADLVLRDKETEIVAASRRQLGRPRASRPRGLGPVLRAALPLLDRRQQLLPPRHRPEEATRRCSTASTWRCSAS